jgi:hypothetical protein
MTFRKDNETLIDSMYYEDMTDEELGGLYRTREKRIAAFLKARDYKFRGMEKIVVNNNHGRNKMIIVFCFDGGNTTRRSILEYYNQDNSSVHNVNAKKILSEFANITSLIANF